MESSLLEKQNQKKGNKLLHIFSCCIPSQNDSIMNDHQQMGNQKNKQKQQMEQQFSINQSVDSEYQNNSTQKQVSEIDLCQKQKYQTLITQENKQIKVLNDGNYSKITEQFENSSKCKTFLIKQNKNILMAKISCKNFWFYQNNEEGKLLTSSFQFDFKHKNYIKQRISTMQKRKSFYKLKKDYENIEEIISQYDNLFSIKGIKYDAKDFSQTLPEKIAIYIAEKILKQSNSSLILDVNCGIGNIGLQVFFLEKHQLNVIALDSNIENLLNFQENLQRYKENTSKHLENSSNQCYLDFICGNIFQLKNFQIGIVLLQPNIRKKQYDQKFDIKQHIEPDFSKLLLKAFELRPQCIDVLLPCETNLCDLAQIFLSCFSSHNNNIKTYQMKFKYININQCSYKLFVRLQLNPKIMKLKKQLCFLQSLLTYDQSQSNSFQLKLQICSFISKLFQDLGQNTVLQLIQKAIEKQKATGLKQKTKTILQCFVKILKLESLNHSVFQQLDLLKSLDINLQLSDLKELRASHYKVNQQLICDGNDRKQKQISNSFQPLGQTISSCLNNGSKKNENGNLDEQYYSNNSLEYESQQELENEYNSNDSFLIQNKEKYDQYQSKSLNLSTENFRFNNNKFN